MVKRHRVIRARWIDQNGRHHDEQLKDWKARIFQHEHDHLNGKLYIDMLPAKPKISYSREQSGVSADFRARLFSLGNRS